MSNFSEILGFLAAILMFLLLLIGLGAAMYFFYWLGKDRRKELERRAGVLDQVNDRDKGEEAKAKELRKELREIGRD